MKDKRERGAKPNKRNGREAALRRRQIALATLERVKEPNDRQKREIETLRSRTV